MLRRVNDLLTEKRSRGGPPSSNPAIAVTAGILILSQTSDLIEPSKWIGGRPLKWVGLPDKSEANPDRGESEGEDGSLHGTSLHH